MMLDKVIEPREPTFELDMFNEPLEVKGADAWVRDVIAMAFYEEGTFTDDPDLGVNINREVYNFVNESVATIKSKLTAACDDYLSDVPIEDLIIASYYWEEMDTYVITISVSFKEESNLKSYAAYVTTIDYQLRYIVNQLT
jgi:hypothetical protein